jgi:hypothetical protein
MEKSSPSFLLTFPVTLDGCSVHPIALKKDLKYTINIQKRQRAKRGGAMDG